MPIPPFNFREPVTPGDSLVDKLNIVIGTWAIRPAPARQRLTIGENGLQPAALDEFAELHGMSPLEEQVCALKHHIGANGLGWIFNAPKDSAQAWSQQKVREEFLESLPVGNPPLFTGRLESKKKAGEYRLSADLWLNPTRYAQSLSARAAVEGPLDNRSRVRSFPRPIVFGGEASLDQQDNWIPDVLGYRIEAEPTTAIGRLREYLLNVDTALDEEMCRAANEAGVSFFRAPHYNMNEAEIYWEFACPEPLPTYEALKPAMRSFRRHVQRRDYPNSKFSASTDEILANCPCWSFPSLGNGTLKVYAKTNRRLRIEVSFHTKDVVGVRVRNESRIGVVAQIDLLRVEAAARVNELFAHLCDCYPSGSVTPVSGDPMRHYMDFVATVRKSLEDFPQEGMTAESLSYDMLSLLRQNSAIRVPRGSHFHEAVRKLSRKRPAFLKFRGRGGSGSYVLAPEFRLHFEQLFRSLRPALSPITASRVEARPESFSLGVPTNPDADSVPDPSVSPPEQQGLGSPNTAPWHVESAGEGPMLSLLVRDLPEASGSPITPAPIRVALRNQPPPAHSRFPVPTSADLGQEAPPALPPAPFRRMPPPQDG
jgi:hypothetical protein